MTPLRKAAIAFREALVKNSYRDIVISLSKKKFLKKNSEFFKNYFATPNESDVESLLSHDETLIGDEAIVGPSFNIPYNEKFIQGNRIHKELAGIENTYKMLFYQAKNDIKNVSIMLP